MDHFRSSFRMLGQGDARLMELLLIYEDFLKNPNAELFSEPSGKEGEIVHKIRLLGEMNEEAQILVGEVARNYRSALDFGVIAAIRHNSKTETRASQFPISKRDADWSAAIRKKTKGCADKVVQYIESLRVFPGENDVLFSLNGVRNAATHIEIQNFLLRSNSRSFRNFKNGANTTFSIAGPVPDEKPGELTIGWSTGGHDVSFNELEVRVQARVHFNEFTHAMSIDELMAAWKSCVHEVISNIKELALTARK